MAKHITLTLALFAAVCAAAPIEYNTLASWQAAGPQDANTITFDGIGQGSYSTLPNVGLYGFTFNGIGGNMLVYADPVTFWWTNLGYSPSLTAPQGSSNYLQIVVPAGVYGIGFYAGTSGVTGSISVVVNNDNANPFTFSAPTPAPNAPANVWWGIRNDVPITVLTITGSLNTNPIIDQVVFGGQGAPPPPPNETPEVGSGLMIGAALAGLAALRRRFVQPALA